MADAVSTALGAVPGLTVWPVGAVEDIAGAGDTIEACRRLGVGHLLEGAVRAQRRTSAGLRTPGRRAERPHAME